MRVRLSFERNLELKGQKGLLTKEFAEFFLVLVVVLSELRRNGEKLRFCACILVSMPGLDGVLPIASTTCCPSFESTKSMNSFAALLCGAFAAPPIGCRDTVTGSRVVTHSTGAPCSFIFSILWAKTIAIGNSPAAMSCAIRDWPVRSWISCFASAFMKRWALSLPQATAMAAYHEYISSSMAILP